MFRKTYKNMNQKLSPDKWLQSEMVKNMEAYREGGARPQLRAKSRTAAILTGALAVCLLVVAIGFTPMVRGFLFGPDALLTQAFGAQEEEDDFNEQALPRLPVQPALPEPLLHPAGHRRPKSPGRPDVPDDRDNNQ